MKYLAILFSLTLLAGCAVPQYNYTPVSVDVSEPPLDSVNIVYVGDIMLEQGRYTEHEAIRVKNNIRVGWAYSVAPGYFLKQGEDAVSGFYYPSGGADSGDIDKIGLADPWQSLQVYDDKNILCVITVFNVAACNNSNQFERTTKAMQSANLFQQTLIYNGRVGNKVNIGYREFSGSLARPAFSNNVEYDMGESLTIGYKGAQIRILEATNEFIRYRVIRNFNNAEF